MAVKRSFKDMLPPLAAVSATAAVQTPEEPTEQTVRPPAVAKPDQLAVPAQPQAQQASAVAGKEDVPAASVRPHYTQLVRKELRVFQDQAMDLKILTMTINNSKLGMGERITDNTLVRVAIDLLLERKADLSGTTESELRNSLNLPPRY